METNDQLIPCFRGLNVVSDTNVIATIFIDLETGSISFENLDGNIKVSKEGLEFKDKDLKILY